MLQVYVGIRSRQLKKWRAQQRPPVRRDDGVAAGPLGNLSSEAKWLDWNLADRGQRASTIRDVVSHIEDLALPWFEAFADFEQLTKLLGRDVIPNLRPAEAIELLVWLDRPDVAEQHARLWLAEQPIAESFEREMRRLKGRPPTGNEYLGNLGEEIARAVSAYGLTP